MRSWYLAREFASHPPGVVGRRRRPAGLACLVPALLMCLGGCGGAPSPVGPGLGARGDSYDPRWGVSSSRRIVANGPIPKGGGHYKLGRPYQVGGRWYVPRHEPSYDRVGVGSWYGNDFHGRKTANGEIFDMEALTAAHPTLPMPSYAYVTNLRNGRTLLVRINDRGPYVADREIDLSRASAQALGYANGGLGQVRVRWAGHAPLDGDDRREQAFLRQQTWYRGADARVARSAPPRGPWTDSDAGSWRASPRGDAVHRRSAVADANGAEGYAPDFPQRDDDLRRRPGEPARDDWRQPAPPRANATRYAEVDNGNLARSDRRDRQALAPAQEPGAMWSPFEHRQQLGNAPRR